MFNPFETCYKSITCPYCDVVMTAKDMYLHLREEYGLDSLDATGVIDNLIYESELYDEEND